MLCASPRPKRYWCKGPFIILLRAHVVTADRSVQSLQSRHRSIRPVEGGGAGLGQLRGIVPLAGLSVKAKGLPVALLVKPVRPRSSSDIGSSLACSWKKVLATDCGAILAGSTECCSVWSARSEPERWSHTGAWLGSRPMAGVHITLSSVCITSPVLASRRERRVRLTIPGVSRHEPEE